MHTVFSKATLLRALCCLAFVCNLSDGTAEHSLDEKDTNQLEKHQQDARAGPFDVRPPLPVSSSEKPTTPDQPLGGAAGLLGGSGLPELGSGSQQSPVQSSLIIGAFQAIITPFNPGMLGSVIGALGGAGGGGGGAPGLPSFPIGSKPQ
ncbi:uncharacterized protein LOC128724981 [Anopheles nili]|uniref:uncharacterized protein LOC128724981 n=1 Tax=Anopheles nili TaxID=185578 RepID=UPI00237C2AE1|nr:uncharacterized protein LOC128724981 [Anopheles nili]